MALLLLLFIPPFVSSCHKKADASEAEIRLNEDRFEKLMRALRTISNSLKAQFQRNTLLLGNHCLLFIVQ